MIFIAGQGLADGGADGRALGTVTKVVCCVDLLETTLLETGLADGSTGNRLI